MTEQATCPIAIIVLHSTNKSPVRTIECQAVVYRHRERLRYYYLNFGKYHLRVHLREDMTGFYARITEDKLHLVDFPGKFPN